VPGVQLLSLQDGTGREQLPALLGLFPVIGPGSQLDETTGAFLDTSAVMKKLDLVITWDTAISRLAVALGVPGGWPSRMSPTDDGCSIARTVHGIPPFG
jgi:hypothetical protein